MTNKAVFFDFDGTIGNTIPGILATFEATGEKMGVEFPREELLKYMGTPLTKMGPPLVGEERTAEMVTTYLSLFPSIAGEMVEFFPGVDPMIRSLREREVIIGIVTSKRRDNLRQNLKKVNGEDLFDFLVTCDDTDFHKPHPAPVEKALERATAEPQSAVMVGDSTCDILAGKGAGCTAIGVTWGAEIMDTIQTVHPDYIVNSIPELQEKLMNTLF